MRESGIGGEPGSWRAAGDRCCAGDALNRSNRAIPAFNASRTSLLRTTCSDIAGSRAGWITVLPARFLCQEGSLPLLSLSETGHHWVVSNPSGRLPAPARRSWPAAACQTPARTTKADRCRDWSSLSVVADGTAARDLERCTCTRSARQLCLFSSVRRGRAFGASTSSPAQLPTPAAPTHVPAARHFSHREKMTPSAG